jgi:hypothetical protein
MRPHPLILTAVLLWPVPLAAQQPTSSPLAGQSGAGWFPMTFAVQPIAGARSGADIGTGPLLVRRDRPGGSGEFSPEADVAFGYRVPVFRFADGGSGGPAVDLGLEAGVLARFALGDGLNGLVNSDFRVAFPAGADFGDWEASLAPVHVSSHAGDDYISETPGFDRQAVSRNGLEGRVMYHVNAGLRLYGGVDYNWAAVRIEKVGGHIGFAFDPPPGSGRSFRPVGGLEVEATDFTTGPGFTGMAGFALPTGAGDLRLGLTGHTGPSRMGQFRRYDETYVGVFLGFVPSVVVRSGDGES